MTGFFVFMVGQRQARNLRYATGPNMAHAGIHPMADDMTIRQVLYQTKRLPMVDVKIVGRVEGTEVLNDACFLDIGVATCPLHWRGLQGISPCPVSAKAGGPGKCGLER